MTGAGHVQELAELLAGLDACLLPHSDLPRCNISLEGGRGLLGPMFSEVEPYCEDSWRVSEAGGLVDYILSGRNEPLGVLAEKYAQLAMEQVRGHACDFRIPSTADSSRKATPDGGCESAKANKIRGGQMAASSS